MPLTPQEEQELAQLESAAPKGLSPEEEAELQALERDAAQQSGAGVGQRINDIIKAGGVSQWMQQQPKPEGPQQPVAGTPPLAMPLAMAPRMLQGLAKAQEASAMARAAGGGIQGAIEGAAGDSEDPLSGGAKGALAGLLLGGMSEGVGKALRKSGDVAMQAAVGRKKYTPSVGETLVDEGVGGTTGMMRRQVDEKLSKRGAEMESLAEAATKGGTRVDVTPEVLELGKRRAVQMGVKGAKPSESDIPKIKATKAFLEDIESRGAETPTQILSRRRAAGGRAYRGKEDPLQSLLGQLSKDEQATYSRALKKAVPGIDEADKAYAALKRAETPLNTDPSLPKSIFQLISTGAQVAPGGAAGLSAIGHAGVRGGRGVQGLNNPALRDALLSPVLRKEE